MQCEVIIVGAAVESVCSWLQERPELECGGCDVEKLRIEGRVVVLILEFGGVKLGVVELKKKERSYWMYFLGSEAEATRLAIS